MLLFVAGNSVVSVFNSEQNILLQHIALTGLKLYFAAIPFVGFNIMISAYFTSTEKALSAQVISLLRGVLVLLPVAFLLSSLLKMTGVWLSYPVTECLTAITAIAFIIKMRYNKWYK